MRSVRGPRLWVKPLQIFDGFICLYLFQLAYIAWTAAGSKVYLQIHLLVAMRFILLSIWLAQLDIISGIISERMVTDLKFIVIKIKRCKYFRIDIHFYFCLISFLCLLLVIIWTYLLLVLVMIINFNSSALWVKIYDHLI